MFDTRHSISLLFNANKVYDREVIAGIGNYLQASKVNWDIYLEEDFLCRLQHIEEWSGDGIIADFDDATIRDALKDINKPVIGVGGSFQDANAYPNVPYVATDNFKLVEYAYKHLKNKAIERFAFYGIPHDESHCWARERKNAFSQLTEADGYSCHYFEGIPTTPDTWQYAMNRLADWLQRLPKPIGILAVTDSRARHILQACDQVNIAVPDMISVIGIDNDEIARHLSRISLSSVNQGCVEMGYRAAKLLHNRLNNDTGKLSRIMVPPTGVIERQSTDYQSLRDPFVIQAMQFIRQNATLGIKVEQVTDYVGMSRSNLEPRFIAERGHTVHTEIHNEKLRRACRLLKTSEMPAKEIAQLCGYPSIQYMYAVFKKHFDQTPKQYRDTPV